LAKQLAKNAKKFKKKKFIAKDASNSPYLQNLCVFKTALNLPDFQKQKQKNFAARKM
jgi:hypothetical protein